MLPRQTARRSNQFGGRGASQLGWGGTTGDDYGWAGLMR